MAQDFTSSGPTAPTATPPGPLYCPSCETQYPASTGERCPVDDTRLVRLAAGIDPMLGRELEGRYTIRELLGQGGMGAVYRASQHSVGRDVAVKVVSPGLVTNAEVIKRFLRECKLSSRIAHPNAVNVLDFGQTPDGVFFLVMELVAGRTLDSVIESEHALKPERVIRIGVQICDALEGAHSLKVIHRDLKPSNVMLLHSGRDLVKVLDFGLAKSLSPDSTITTMTNAGAMMGTPAFMPPELATGQECDERADLYSLGCMLFYMAAGRLPFVSESIHELISMHAYSPPPLMTGLPPKLGAVLLRLLQKDPSMRFASAAATREALEAALPEATSWLNAAPKSLPMATEVSVGPFPADPAMFAALRSNPLPPQIENVAPARASDRNLAHGATQLGVGPNLAAHNAATPRSSQPQLVSGAFASTVPSMDGDEVRAAEKHALQRRARWRMIGVLTLALGVGGAVWVWNSSRQSTTPPPSGPGNHAGNAAAGYADAAPATPTPADAVPANTAAASTEAPTPTTGDQRSPSTSGSSTAGSQRNGMAPLPPQDGASKRNKPRQDKTRQDKPRQDQAPKPPDSNTAVPF